ncbi:patatin-like phospholipase family protein [Beijerinckia sp. L45]|uniref:patatin-like phospholipase family protein n=1 Tax=Beijerinckia sp. L45 TaxID=1641855 RepID=UPI001FF02499|nr:patatin-like phospholipase family protein [Beijerinckia sp. L45]
MIAPIVPHVPGRPVIGLALGAGSARGWAHIGVLRELADHGIHPDVVAGTSIGAVVGGAYAAGKLDTLEAFARGLNRRRVFTLMDLSFQGTGLIAGARLKRRLNRDLVGLAIEALPIPFAAVAAEMATGREVVMTEGDLVESIRASYALPGIFEPILVDGRWIFDGALANPVPVSVCRSLGADVVIAVNLSADISRAASETDPGLSVEPELDELVSAAVTESIAAPFEVKKKRRRIFARRRLFTKRADGGAPGIASVMMDAFAISQDHISRERLAADPPDIMINARLTTCGSFDFHRAAQLIEYGRVATRRAMPAIEALLGEAKVTA